MLDAKTFMAFLLLGVALIGMVSMYCNLSLPRYSIENITNVGVFIMCIITITINVLMYKKVCEDY
jgi:ABC-type multidrug transport system permease subunit